MFDFESGSGMNTWNLRDDILTITHRWYVIVVFVLLGSLVGLGCSFIWPSPFRATLDLYIGLNPYRSPFEGYQDYVTKQTYEVVDDYKNWQMGQLNVLVLSDSYIEETLIRLRSQDPAWEAVSPSDFRDMASVLWRNVGRWHLVVEADDPEQAKLAAEEWGQVITEKVNEAVSHSKQVVALDVKMSVLTKERNSFVLRLKALEYVREELSEQGNRLASLPVGQVVSPYEHWKMMGLVSQVVKWDSVWNSVFEDTPTVGSPVDIYIAWLNVIDSIISEELIILPEQISILDDQFSTIAEQYNIESAKGYGLASTLVLEKDIDETPQVKVVRPVGVLVIIGGLIGLLSWALWEVYKISRKS